jgi:hypothetical protein
MTLRESLGRDVQRVHEQVDALLEREDGLLVLFDGNRMVSYTQGFGVSPDQLELLSIELERAVRNVVGGRTRASTTERRNREESSEAGGRGRSAGLRQHLGRDGRSDHGSLVDARSEGSRSGDVTHGISSGAAGRVLRLASKTA